MTAAGGDGVGGGGGGAGGRIHKLDLQICNVDA